MHKQLSTCEEAAKTGGKVLSEMLGKVTSREKAKHDLVTEADLSAQQAVVARIRQDCPDHTIIGEESVEETNDGNKKTSPYTWVIDPLDGTTNYVHGFPHFCVSVALVKKVDDRNQLVAATIYDPCRDESFTANAGNGAFLNGSPIRVSSADAMERALLAASLPPQVTTDSVEVRTLLSAMTKARSVRRTGSAALNLAYLAAGRLDGYWATSLNSWDAAAGALLVQEAGGLITAIDGGEFDVYRPRLVAASTNSLHKELRGMVQSLV